MMEKLQFSAVHKTWAGHLDPSKDISMREVYGMNQEQSE
jgi:hypothetical protein